MRGLSMENEMPTIMYEDNSTCINELKEGYIKGDRTKHISPNLFYAHDLQHIGDIDIQKFIQVIIWLICSIKALPSSTFEKLVYKIGMCQLRDIK